MNYDDIEQMIDQMFMRYGSPAEFIEFTNRISISRPDILDSIDRVLYYDGYAAECMKGLQRSIEKLQLYRIALQRRYNYLVTSPTADVIKLSRKRDGWSNKVFYYLTLCSRNILDGHDVVNSTKKYEGRQRHIAIADYRQYIKDHPGVIAETTVSGL